MISLTQGILGLSCDSQWYKLVGDGGTRAVFARTWLLWNVNWGESASGPAWL